MKLFKKYYLVLLLILCLSSGIIYGSYALYTTGADFSNTVSIGTDITYTFDINNMEGFRVSNNSNFRFMGSLTNTIGSTMNYKFYYRVLGATSGVTVKEVASSISAMKSSGSIANNATITPEFYITNTSGSDVTVKIGVRFAYSGTDVVIPSNASEITSNITSSNVKTGNCTTTEIDWSSCRTYTDTSGNVHNCKTVSVGTVNTYKFDINNTESIVVSNNDNYRFWSKLTNTVGSTMNYKFYYKVEGASSGVTVKEVASSASEMKSSGSIVNGASKTIEYYITNTSGKNVTVTVGVSFAYNGNTVTLDSGTSEITTNIKSKDATTGSCTGDGLVRSSCSTYTDNSGNVRKCSNDALATRTSSEMLSYLKLTSKGTRTDFSSVATTDEGVYSAPDDYGTSYYFRGAVTNNYVKFAGAYWRIIRINGDGTIRMIYDGTSAHANGESSADRQLSGTSYFNTNDNDNAYVGYMYGSTGQSGDNAYANTHANTNDSDIKKALDRWYNGLSSTNKGYIVDRVFCGERAVASNSSLFSGYTSYGYGSQKTVYAETSRSYTTSWGENTTQEISFVCTNKNDKYTVSDTTVGNGALSNPVGLITASEVRAAGGFTGSANSSYYLCTGQRYWTISPSRLGGSGARVFYVYSDGSLDIVNVVDGAGGVRPVVSLKSDITFTGGNGSQGSPWIVGTGNA